MQRAHLLTYLQTYRNSFVLQPKPFEQFSARKLSWSGQAKSSTLIVTAAGIEQVGAGVRRTSLCTYFYRDIESIVVMSDVPGGFAIKCTIDHFAQARGVGFVE